MTGNILFCYGWGFDMRAFNGLPFYPALTDCNTNKDITSIDVCLAWSLGIKRLESLLKQGHKFKKIIIINSAVSLPDNYVKNFIAGLKQNKEKALLNFYRLCFWNNKTAFETFKAECLSSYLNRPLKTFLEELEGLLPSVDHRVFNSIPIEFFISENDFIVSPDESKELASLLNTKPLLIKEPHFAFYNDKLISTLLNC